MEFEYAYRKFGERANLIDLKVRNTFNNKVMPSLLKCTIKFNHYATRELLINKEMQDDSCSRCKVREDWVYIILYYQNRQKKRRVNK